MKRKAQNIIEISLLACVIAIIGFSVFVIYNNQKISLADKSKSKIFAAQSVNLNDIDQDMNDIIPYNGNANIPPAGLTYLSMTQGKFNLLMSNITYQNLSDALNLTPATPMPMNLFEYANSALNLDPPLSPSTINSQTISALIDAFNYAIQNPSAAGSSDYLSQFQSLVNSAENTTIEGTAVVTSQGPTGNSCTSQADCGSGEGRID
ncbi:MAG TPA: hypothetical protein PKI94_02035 [Candidatus Gastranaerophilaceae bacterium]|nr:hypothetical protein [Candidatus Gastranaerophilaceae bacterium]